MARKKLLDITGIERHVPEPVKPTLHLSCPHSKNGSTKDITCCLYLCPKSRVTKCPAYLAAYPTLLNFEIDPKYTEKYGPVVILIPAKLRKRRKRRTKEEIQEDAQ